MFDTFRHGEWSDKLTAFWTFGQGAGTYILTVLGVILMIVSLAAWVWLEEKKLSGQVDRLRAASGVGGTRTPGVTGGGNA